MWLQKKDLFVQLDFIRLRLLPQHYPYWGNTNPTGGNITPRCINIGGKVFLSWAWCQRLTLNNNPSQTWAWPTPNSNYYYLFSNLSWKVTPLNHWIYKSEKLYFTSIETFKKPFLNSFYHIQEQYLRIRFQIQLIMIPQGWG